MCVFCLCDEVAEELCFLEVGGHPLGIWHEAWPTADFHKRLMNGHGICSLEDGTSEQVSGARLCTSWTSMLAATCLRDSVVQSKHLTLGTPGKKGLQPAEFAGFCPDSKHILLLQRRKPLLVPGSWRDSRFFC